MNVGDKIELTQEEQQRIAALDKRHDDEESAMHERHREERHAFWQEVRAAHPELEGCLLTHLGDSLYVLRPCGNTI